MNGSCGITVFQPVEVPGFYVGIGKDINAVATMSKGTIASSQKKSRSTLAFWWLLRDIGGERLAVDGPLANPVRTGR